MNEKKKLSVCKVTGRVIALLKDRKKWFVMVVLLTVINGSLFPLFSLLLTQMMLALISENFDTTDLISGLFIVLAVVAFVTGLLVQYLYQYVGTYVTTKIRESAFNSILRKAPTWHDEPGHSSGAMSGILAQEAAQIQGASTRGVGNFMQFIITLIVGIIIALIGEWTIALVLIGLTPLILYGTFMRTKLRMSHLKV